MPHQLEKNIRARASREKIQQKVLVLLTRLTTQSSRIAFAPEKVLLKRLGLRGPDQRKPVYRIRQAVKRLEQKGLVRFEKDSSGWKIHLSDKGKAQGDTFDAMERIRIKKPARWDGRWRIVIFDIWERRRGTRDKLRILLRKAGFYKVQDSVWAHPYDCAELIVFVRTQMRLGQSILYVVADGIENDEKIKKHFNLP